MVVLIVVTIIFCAGISYKIIGMVLLVVVPLIAAFLVYIIATPDPIFMEPISEKSYCRFHIRK